jgi:dihydrolipoamide dehydrogenase
MPSKPTYDYDLIVIGSGAGGSGAATMAAKAGKRVAIVESSVFGGESPNWGDVPTKALLHATQLYDEAKHGARFGIRSSMLNYNYRSLQQWKELVIKRTGVSDNRRYYEKQGIHTFHGTAHFLSPREISVNRRHLSAAHFLVATGAHIEAPDITGLHTINYLTPRTIHDLIRPPKSLLIIGGGRTGVELAQLMATYGTKVYIADIAARLLPHEDQEVGELVERLLKERKGVTTLTQTRILSTFKEGIGIKVLFKRGDIEKHLRVEQILVATGRTPTVDVGLENAGVIYTAKGIEVNDFLQTSARHIYAAGDVLGKHNPTQTTLHESRIAANNILHKTKVKPEYIASPRLTFTYPGVASVGLSEDDCMKRDLVTSTSIAPLSMVARSNTSDFRDGFVKIIADKKGVILGATVVAPHAAEIIHELALAVKYEMTAAELALTPHAFLSWSEAVRVAAARISS